MEKISATVITFNEEKNIRRCLESVKWADEIIVIDSHSKDNTVQIAREYTDKVIQRDWPGHIQQKNFARETASNNWIFSLDADEEVSPELRESILSAQKSGFPCGGYHLARKVYYLGKWINHSGWYPDYKVRLFDRRKASWGGTNPHDRIEINSATEFLSGDLYHYSYENVSAHIQTINNFTTISAEELQKKGKRATLSKLLLNPFFKFIKSFLIKKGFLDGTVGLTIALSGSFYVFLKYLKLWEMQNAKAPK
ncbi:MAG: glycosyltransferase family 2 protein [Calditrichia bacterium]